VGNLGPFDMRRRSSTCQRARDNAAPNIAIIIELFGCASVAYDNDNDVTVRRLKIAARVRPFNGVRILPLLCVTLTSVYTELHRTQLASRLRGGSMLINA